ncbi:ROK family protein [Boudabousia marimammalium]|uniref:Sugar kinase n=1 Tax=Boudabousia marimammalium TaxID=156892 RepID=A0A1Q5PSI8_9ACTO|nr:ROK family protein [Boudabousia marimammalium]OKL50405.1 hypothetical protein BM477_00015 [Boudabousia marimammalium]
MRHVIAIDIGGTKIAGALVALLESGETPPAAVAERLRGFVTARSAVATHPTWTAATVKTGGNDVAATVVSVVQKVIAHAQSHGLTLSGVGIGSAGVIDPTGRMIASATDAIPGWTGTKLADIVEAATGLPVIIENDVHAHARGEAVGGAGNPFASTLMVAVGTGIGGAFTEGSRILRGIRGLSGHVGHIVAPGAEGNLCSCGADGHLEAIASGPGMTRWFNQRGGNAVDARDLEAQAEAGDELAIQVMAEAATATGQIIAGLVNCFDPEVVILGGGLARAGDLYWGPLKAAYQTQLMPALRDTQLLPAALGSAAALVGAGELIRYHLDEFGDR